MDQKSFQELVFKTVKNRHETQWLHRLPFFFVQTKATHFETMTTTVNEVNNDKTKVRDDFIVRSVSLVSFTAELDERKLIHNRCTCMFIIKTTAEYVYANKQSRLCFYVFACYFVGLDIHL